MLQCYFLARWAGARNSYLTGRDHQNLAGAQRPPRPGAGQIEDSRQTLKTISRQGVEGDGPERESFRSASFPICRTRARAGHGQASFGMRGRGSQRPSGRRQTGRRTLRGETSSQGVREWRGPSGRSRDARTASEHLTPFPFFDDVSGPAVSGTHRLVSNRAPLSVDATASIAPVRPA